MEYTLEERGQLIIEDCMKLHSTNPVQIFITLTNKDYMRIHGPEHHVLDGASILTAFFHAGGKIDLRQALEKLMAEGLRMPGATCGLWGVCGAVTSIGAALAIIDGTGPLSEDGTWGKHMEFTSKALGELARVNGPRCCKRDAFLAFEEAIKFINENYSVELTTQRVTCGFSKRNDQCIKGRCPFYVKKKIYLDMTGMKSCTSVWMKDTEIIPAGATVYAMSSKHKNAEYERFSREYDINFIFDDNIPVIDFYTIPRIDIFATDSRGGYIGTVGKMTDLEGDAPICYIDKDRQCYLICKTGKEFLQKASSWKTSHEPYKDIIFYSSKAEAMKEKEFLSLDEFEEKPEEYNV